jgi:mono/diheme cytochrome c family protein
MRRSALRFAISAVVLLGTACDRAPTPEREWAPRDHDQEPAGQSGQQAAPNGSAKPNIQQQLVETAWAQTCNTCHGPLGKGDGPQGALVKAPNLTDPDWQAKVTDEEIAARIKSGKGLMPPNDLPEPIVKGLVARIRALKGR